MRINDAEGSIVFDNLISAKRTLGQGESIFTHKPAEKAVACNAAGVFETRDLVDINARGEESAKKLVDLLKD